MIYLTSTYIEDKALDQAFKLMQTNSYNYEDLFLLPDAHYCNGLAPVGTALFYKDQFDYNIVSADIGCGVAVYKLSNINTEHLHLLSYFIKNKFLILTPEGKERKRVLNLLDSYPYSTYFKFEELRDIFYKSYGTLGGGNHFIELSKCYNDRTGEREYYIVIHCGSRTLGGESLKKIQALAKERTKEIKKIGIKIATERLKKIGAVESIPNAIKDFNNKESEYVFDISSSIYENFHTLCCWFARKNREFLAKKVAEFLCSTSCELITDTIHNYVDYDRQIVHKGSIGVNRGDIVAIPLNMRDGTILGRVNANVSEWGYNLPHGAGRKLSRKEAKNTISEEQYLQETKDIITEGIHIDESPSSYKDSDYIINILKDKLDDIKIIKPIYSYKE